MLSIRTRTQLTAVAALLPLFTSYFTLQASAQAIAEPAGNQILFGAWIDTQDGADYPAEFNRRIGFNTSVFQISQDMPLPEYDFVTGAGGPAPEYLVEQSFTDAAVFLTVYPTTLALTDDDYTTLGNQLKNYTDNYDRTVFLRFAPEMQGTWNPAFGFQPVAFKAMWATMYSSIKSIAPNTIIVWAPNLGTGYPYGQTPPTNAAEVAELDTNGDGQITALDDPYSPYYPGDDQVDWIGISVYWKGPNYGENVNAVQPDNYCEDIMNSIDPFSGLTGPSNFYQTYCTKANKACMFSESGAAYHVDVAGGATDLAIKQAWWRDCLLNNDFLDTFPRIKMLMQFEYEKVEGDAGIDDLRDYRLVNKTDIMNAFSTDLAAFATRVQWADYRQPPSDIPSSGIPADQPGGSGAEETSSVCTKYCGQVAFTTQRNPATGAPSLFGNTRESSALRLQATIAVGATSLLMLVGATFLAGRSSRQAAL